MKWVLRHRLFTLLVAIATLVATIYLYLVVPKGLLPNQDTGEIIGVTDAAQNISFKADLADIAGNFGDGSSMRMSKSAGSEYAGSPSAVA